MASSVCNSYEDLLYRKKKKVTQGTGVFVVFNNWIIWIRCPDLSAARGCPVKDYVNRNMQEHKQHPYCIWVPAATILLPVLIPPT